MEPDAFIPHGNWCMGNHRSNRKKDPLLGVMGAILFVMAVMNINCFGANDCKTPRLSPKTIPTLHHEEIDFEEIK